MALTIERPASRPRWWMVGAVLILYTVLGFAYGVVNPLFEAPDELLHYQFIRHLVEQRALPVQSVTTPTEFHQPPLYYALSALISAPFSDSGYVPQLNVFWRFNGQPPLEDNKNLYLHTAAESFPYRGTTLNLHVLRGFSVLLGIVTLVIVFQLASVVFAARPWLSLGALATTAFNPQFLFSTSSVNNDVLVTLLGAAMLWWSIRAVQRGLTWRLTIVGGLLCGAALLTKLSAGALVGVVVLAILLAPPSRVSRLAALLTICGIPLLLTAWWFVRNLQLYAELTGLNTMLVAWRSATALTSPTVGAQSWNLWRSYWAEFGYGQITPPDWIYWLIALVALAGLLGLVRWWRLARKGQLQPDRKVAAILISALLLLLIASIVFGAQNPSGMHGRFLLPASAAVSILLLVGWRSWWRPLEIRLDRFWSGGVALSMLALAIYALFGVLRPAYAAPVLLTQDAVQHNTTPANIRFGENATLLGYRLDVTLCWEVLQPAATDDYAFVYLLGEANSKIAERRTYIGLGHYPTTQWSSGDVFCDRIPLEISPNAKSGVYDVEVGLVDSTTQKRLPARTSDGAEIPQVVLDRIKVRSSLASDVPASSSQPIDFGGQIKLLASTVEPLDVSAGQSVTATMYWQAVRVPDRNYTVFVQLWNSLDQQVANADSMPQAGRYPTSFWDANEIVSDTHRIDLPANLPRGEYRIIIGWYDLQSGARLPRDGTPEDSVQIANIEVSAP